MRADPRSLLAGYRFVRDLKAPAVAPTERQRIERVLAGARVCVAVAALLAVTFDPTPDRFYPFVTDEVLWLYLMVSIAAWIVLRLQRSLSPRFALTLHLGDLVWAALLTTLTEGGASPFLIFLIFVELAAAYRWGLLATVATAVGAIAGLVLGPLIASGTVQVYAVLVGASYLSIVAVLVGYLSEGEIYRRAELATITEVMSEVQAAAGLDLVLARTFRHVLRICRARVLLLVIEESDSKRALLFRSIGAGARVEGLRAEELSPGERDTYFFPVRAAAWATTRRVAAGDAGAFESVAIDADGKRAPNVHVQFPAELRHVYELGSTVGIALGSGVAWTGRLLISGVHEPAIQQLRFLQKLVTHLAPAIYSSYVLRRLRSRLGGLERTRLAQDLHDGIIQSLIGLQMHIDALRHTPRDDHAYLVQELGRVREMLADEVAAARDLMRQVKPVVFQPHELPTFIADLAERFQRETGIAAHFTYTAGEIDLSSRTCRELARIVQEALANVRRHSGARHVTIGLAATDRQWLLTVENDGQPFDFAGRLDLRELEAARKGPALIKERVREIGGGLTVVSDGGRVGLEITVDRPRTAASDMTA